MPKQGKSDAEWKTRLREYAEGKFKFGQGQRPPKNSRWAKDIGLIEKCPVLCKTKLFGGISACNCGYHDSFTPPHMSTVAVAKTVVRNDTVPALPAIQQPTHISQSVEVLKAVPTENIQPQVQVTVKTMLVFNYNIFKKLLCRLIFSLSHQIALHIAAMTTPIDSLLAG